MFRLFFDKRLSTVVGLVHHNSLLGRALRTVAVLALVAAPLLAPPSAYAMNNWETALMGNYPGSNLTYLCGNCHAGFSGREIGNPNRADYWIWTAKGGTPATNSPYYTNDHDMDGTTTHQEYVNSQSLDRPPITVDWFPGYPDKDNDGCIQIYNRLGEVGMPNNVRDIITDGGIGGKGFDRYVPWGWDQDDNDATQGCNLTWPTIPDFPPPGFTTPVTTSDDGNPPSELPAAITDFRASGRIAAAIPLVWTAVGDDGMTGNAHSYDLRYTTQAKALAALQCGVGDAAGTSACQVRNRGHWSRMYDLIGGTVDGSGCSVLTKTAGVTIDCVGGNVEWNNGPSNSPLMRAFYEPVPTAPGSAQGCSLAPGQSATCTLTTAPAPSYVLKAQGVAISNQTPVPINTITNGELYWLATRVSDGVLQISGVLEAPTGFTENVSLSNIVAITAGTTGTAITAITGGASISGTSGTISITGLGLTTTSAARLALVRADGTTAHFVVSPTIVGGTSASASFTGLAAGTYTLETQTSAGATTAAWVDAVTVTGTPPVFSSITPNQGGQGATSRLLTLGGSDLAGGTLSFSGTGIASVPVSGSGPFTASINIDAGASATVRDATVTTASGSSTLPSSFTVTAAPTFSCTPAISLTGTVGVAYPTSVCTASGGSPAGTSYTWTPAAVPPSLSAVVSGTNSETLTVSGTPTAAGTFATTIRLSDGNGGTIIVPYTIVIAKGTPIITCSPTQITYPEPLSATHLNCTANVPGTFTYNPPLGTVLNAGTQTITVGFTPTDTANYNSVSSPFSLVVNKGTPIITCSPTQITYPTPLSATHLNCTANVPGTFTYGPATGTILNAGTQTITVTFTPTDTANYNSVSSLFSLVVNKGTPVITWANPAAITYGTALSGTQLNATSVPGTFVYTPAAGAVLTAGTQTLSTAFTPTDTANYNNASATATLVVNPASQTVTINCPASLLVNAGGTCTGSASSGLALSFTATGACTVSSAGAVTAAATEGTCSVTATTALDANYTPNPASASVSFPVTAVTKITPVISCVAPAPITYPTALSPAQFDCSATDPNTLAALPGSSAYSPALGTVLGAGAQTLSVTFTPTDTATYNNGSTTFTLVVNKGTPTITWANPAAITYGTALSGTQLNATASVPGAFVYTPAAGAVLNVGTQTLSTAFTPTDTANYNNASATATLVVNKATPTITWANPAAITYGTALSGTQLNATASVPGAFVYTPAAGAVLNAGTQTLSTAFTPTDTANYNNASATATLVVNPASQTVTINCPASLLVNAGGSCTGSASSGLALSFTASGACTVTSAGAVTAAATEGTCSVTATTALDANYTPNPASASVSFPVTAVTKITPVISCVAPAPITYPTALSPAQFDCSATDPNTLAALPGSSAYSPALGTVLGAGTQTLSVTFTPTDTATYNNGSTTFTLVVNKGTPTITWANPAAITYGTALSGTQLNATASVPGAFVYTPAAGAVLNAGTQTLSTAFTPTDTANYNNASATATLVVNKATPTITWANPAAITYGTALSGTQLNASASVPGTFVYTPAAGAVLNAGTQTLSTAFTPTDTANYNNASATATLVVNPASQTVTINCPASLLVNAGGSCTGSASSGLALSFTATGACTVSSAGEVFAAATKGTCTVSATTAANSNYTPNPASASASIAVYPAATVITSPSTASGTEGALFSYQITATNDPAAGGYAASPLPPGLSVSDVSGLISGTPSTAGTYSVTVQAFNGPANGGSASQVVTITINTVDIYTVTGTAGVGGTITPAIQSVGLGAMATFTIVPDAGYAVALPIGGNCPVGTLIGTTYTTGPITVNCTVEVSFPDIVPPVLVPSPLGSYTTIFTSPLIVTLSSNEPGITIFYTMNGGTPTTSSPLSCIAPCALEITRSTLLQYRARDAAGNVSASAYQVYKIAAVDLVMAQVVKTSTTVKKGTSFAITNAVRNMGSQSTLTPFKVSFYLSSDKTITTADRKLGGERTINGIQGRSTSSSVATSMVVPTATPTGVYYVGACVDPDNRVLESTEGNNCKIASSSSLTASITINVTN